MVHRLPLFYAKFLSHGDSIWRISLIIINGILRSNALSLALWFLDNFVILLTSLNCVTSIASAFQLCLRWMVRY